MGGKYLIAISNDSGFVKFKEFTYGDKRFDDYGTRKEARKAAITFGQGAHMMFDVISNQTKLDIGDLRRLIKDRW